jgi:hypothetical protein
MLRTTAFIISALTTNVLGMQIQSPETQLLSETKLYTNISNHGSGFSHGYSSDESDFSHSNQQIGFLA